MQMTATIKYEYDAAGQRASLIAGGDGKEAQTITIDISAADLDVIRIASDGTMSADATGWRESTFGTWHPHYFSTVPSPADLILSLREQAAARAAHAEQAKAEAERKAEAGRTARADRRTAQLAQLAADLADPSAVYAASELHSSSYRYSDLTSEERAPMIARCMAADAAKAKRDAHLKALPLEAAPRETTLLADGTYEFDVPEPTYTYDWAKRVVRIDPGATNGFAFQGDWLPKPGQTANLAAGELVLVGGKRDRGSRKHPNVEHYKKLYVVTPAGVRFVESGEACKSAAIKYLAMSPAERVGHKLAAHSQLAVETIAKLDALDLVEYADVADEIAKRRAGWVELRDACQRVLDGTPADDKIADIDSAAAAIVSAGFRALSKTHHPDAGGSAETMALLSAARAQLREMLALALANVK
jgi:hypothetical protein